MWEEDLEEDEEEYARQLQALKELNARTWSHESDAEMVSVFDESTSNDHTPVPEAESPQRSPVMDTFSSDIDGDLVADGFFFHEAPAVVKQPEDFPLRYSPPAKRSGVDKWAALGERRRARADPMEGKSPEPALKTQRQFGFGFNSSTGVGMGMWDQTNQINSKWNRDRTRSRDCPWNNGRDFNWRKEKRHDFVDIEWVGHWQESH